MTSPDSQTADQTPDEAATREAFFEAFGGVRGMVETTVPGLVFVLIFTITREINPSAIGAVSLSAVLALARLARRDSVKHALSGVFGVAFGAAFAMISGDAKNFYLPGMIYTLCLSVIYLVSAAAGWPLLGLLLGPIFRENLSWRTRNPGRKRAYVKSSLVWGGILLAKSCITFPIYFWGDATQLGWLRVALGIPPFLIAVYFTWIILVKAPAPIDVIAEWEAKEAREAKEAEEAKRAAAGEPVPDGEPAAGRAARGPLPSAGEGG
ncbi:DUF3159 domain-containing protein [Streptomyces sp. DSM 44915]|uniref:DUF3159 domain-containing protein n=1 Tax=Streptomyces chisholmiae TaxID=3075540 RepID=A0ABU2JML5_9ACTN|nr:DUF3159 domain-containing protein [Streptomyces sp. DSM 44915]MDT0266231.1 DUF3159 domain-containing protein [Streptomyces sp. DSM 44915]